MFNFFKKTPKPNRQADQIFMSIGAKFLNLGKIIKQLANNQVVIILIYFFPKTGEDLKTVLDTFELPAQNLDGQPLNASIGILSAENFRQARPSLENLKNQDVRFMVVEHYPLPAEDELLIARIGEISMNFPITFYCALDEPLFKLFGSENIQKVMLAMGMDEEEAISHNMITQSIARAQKRIAEKVKMDLKTDSAAEWFAKNIG
ncbi:MAG: hypothetical protein MUE85_06470 [Microscillaceae bacterium]|jgi:hypothetical protein|nr:hypothetical protein [Microscillaceae bacterium]